MERLPEELLVYAVSLTSPIDACRAAADSDVVWSRFLPRSLPRFAKGDELPRTPASKKELFRRLSVQPVLLQHKTMSMQLDRSTGAERLTLSGRTLQISRHPEAPKVWRWVPSGLGSNYSKRDKRFFFSEAAKFRDVNILEIGAKIQRKMLSHNATYVAYMVFKLDPPVYSHSPFQEASIEVAGSKAIRQVCLQGYVVEDGDGAGDPSRNVHVPRKMDGWMEVELGEFYNGESDGGGVVSISFVETSEGRGRTDCLLVWGIELRSKQH